MVPVSIPTPQVCIIEHCPTALLARHRAFSGQLRMKALQVAPALPAARPSAAPDDVLTGGGSGGGAVMGGEGAPGSGTGVPSAFTGPKLF